MHENEGLLADPQGQIIWFTCLRSRQGKVMKGDAKVKREHPGVTFHTETLTDA